MMVKCPFCGATYVANTVFCSGCGNYLLEDSERKTDPLRNGEIGWVGVLTKDDDASLSENAEPTSVHHFPADGYRWIGIPLHPASVSLPLHEDWHTGGACPPQWLRSGIAMS